ncbi:MAG: DNA helicase RecQ [Bacilli bacterium]
MTLAEKMNEAKAMLKKYWGYDDFRPVQSQIIENILRGQSTCGILPTGGGKSICYQVPALCSDGLTIVISPLISLMKDQVDALLSIGVQATYFNSSLDSHTYFERIQRLKNGEFSLVYIAPERLDNMEFLSTVREQKIALVAVDEAHCMSEWGHDFRPSYATIGKWLDRLGQSPVRLALTATATPQVQTDVMRQMNITPENLYVGGFARSNLRLAILHGQKNAKWCMRWIKSRSTETGIIYCTTRKEVESIFSALQDEGISVAKYHAGLSDMMRSEMQQQFINDEVSVIVATNAFGMGIDKSNVRYVIHYGMPKTIEAYYQEAGRAGRDGLESECVLLFSAQDVQTQRFLIEQNTTDQERSAFELGRLQDMKNLAMTENCILQYIVNYFGEQSDQKCGKCSSCLDKREQSDVTTKTQMALSCVIRMKERFGKAMVANVLKGSSNQKVKSFGLDELSTYGLMKADAVKNITMFLDWLIAEGYLDQTRTEFPTVFVTDKGREVLLGKEKVMRKEAIEQVSVSKEKDSGLFELLREVRRELAQTHKVPPYIICSDETLRNLCARLPQTPKEMLEVKGLGEHKVETYGEAFLSVIKQWKYEKPVKSKGTYKESVALFEEGKDIAQIAAARELAESTVERHLLDWFEEGNAPTFERFMTEDIKKRIAEDLMLYPESPLKERKERLGEDVSYFQLRLGKWIS